MHNIFDAADLPRYYVEHFPPMVYAERDLDAFDTLEEAEDFAKDCARGGENARIFGEMAQMQAADYGAIQGNEAGEAQDWSDWLVA